MAGKIKPNGNCSALYITSFLCGLLGNFYAHLCGGLLFCKFLRFRANAPIIFSAGAVIQYCNQPNYLSSQSFSFSDDDDSQSPDRSNNPCPILQFQLVNRYANDFNIGQVIDVSLQAIAADFSVNEEDVSDLSFSFDLYVLKYTKIAIISGYL